ncbi:hypothetical protein TGME49_233370 [Toxoplasma gondii ME49]|uniref:Transmembrane protein n=3 Tax=Toxoplasma gondii TaxID=5811 RepID=S8F5K5_TOXGM|nr:hypothetical protein TGME49_233370 [Toxoplasma gondii ME49]EPT28773.1 hypothetical protein TGME49_233370 [Toxoplasma gondii ME49]ESS35847.1 putative transmembrane protein [Toxoplasma gondii VEG]KYF46316.1 hypothetical protein TGARI_233370 [Toxoplasma gondii ARI]CEL75000.1 TPA: hypothetical protein BN1205_022180 [Toxoplasma gondii VEG]|eukprot:XP_018636781.1 hypothetical protein TGME49_233370 [Toxoplasma gondii ME49]
MKVFLPATVFCLSSGILLARAEPDTDCQGEYGPWSVCEPLEGHATHHDSDDDFKLDRGPDGEFTNDCFHFQTYKIVVPKSGNGRDCSRKEGSKRFRYCDDCSRIPSVHKRLEAQQATDSFHTFTIIAGIFCLFAMVALTALCVRKVLKDTSSRTEQVTLYSPGPPNPSTQQPYPADTRGPNTTSVTMTPEYPHHSAKDITAETDRNTEAGGSEYGA